MQVPVVLQVLSVADSTLEEAATGSRGLRARGDTRDGLRAHAQTMGVGVQG